MIDATIAPEANAIRQHIELLIDQISPDCRLKLELAWGVPKDGPCHGRCFGLSELPSAVQFAADVNVMGCNVYLGITLKAESACSNGRTNNQHAALATVLPIDIDDDLTVAARRLPPGLRPRLMTVTGSKPSLRGHLWFQIAATSEFNLWDEALERIVEMCGADRAARGRARVMRLAGTVSYPTSAKILRGYEPELVSAHFIRSPIYCIESLLGSLPLRHNKRASIGARIPVPSFKPDWPKVRLALEMLPRKYADEYDLWLRVGLALHDFDPSGVGLEAWKGFSLQCPDKAQNTDFNRRWASFGRRADRPITIRWLFAETRKQRSVTQQALALSKST